MEQLNNKKLCTQCNEREAKDNHSWCSECYSNYKKTWDLENKEHRQQYARERREQRLQDIIYMFVPVNPIHKDEVLNIGSTTDMAVRMSNHINGHTRPGKLLKDIEYNVVYAEVEGLQNREELYFIEYYLIHKYFLMHGENPIGNERDTFNHNICTSRQFELILIAESLRFKEYDIFRHKKMLF